MAGEQEGHAVSGLVSQPAYGGGPFPKLRLGDGVVEGPW